MNIQKLKRLTDESIFEEFSGSEEEAEEFFRKKNQGEFND